MNVMNLLIKKLIPFTLILTSLFLSQSHSHTNNPGTFQVQLLANPHQRFVVCGQKVHPDDSVVLVAKNHSEPPDKPASISFITLQHETTLQITSPARCTPEQIQDHPISGGDGLYSELPFAAYFVKKDKDKEGEQNDEENSDQDEQGIPFSLAPPALPKVTVSGGGAFGPDDDNQHQRKPYGYFRASSGDVDIDFAQQGDYLPDHISLQSIINMLGQQSSELHTLWVYQGNQTTPSTSIQVTSGQVEELIENQRDEYPLNWLLSKLRPDHQAVFVQDLLELQDAFSNTDHVFTDAVQALIAERLVELLGKSSAEIDLEFERFRLHRDIEELGEEVWESLVLAHRPDAEAVYEGGEVSKFIYQAGDNPPGSGKTQSGTGNRSAGRSGSSSDSDESKEQEQGKEEEVRHKKPATVNRRSSQRVEPLRIVFFGRMSVGKSSLANLLIGYKHFTEMDGETKGSVGNENGETPFKSPELIIRSLAGYDGWNEEEDNYIERNNIKDSDIIVYVVDGPIKPTDKKYIRYFHDKGQRVVFVRNKYQTAMKALLKAAGYDESEITEDVRRDKNYQESYLEARKTIKGNFEKGYRKSLSDIELDSVPQVLLTECIEGEDFCDANLVARIRGLLTSEEAELWRAFRDARVAKKGSINSTLLMELKSFIETDNSELTLFDFLTMRLTEQYRIPENLLPDKEKVTTASNWHRAEEIYQKLHDGKKTLKSLESEVLVDATSTFKTTLLTTGAISAGGTGVMITINTILAVMAATPIDEAVVVGLTSVFAAGGGWVLLPVVGLPILVAGGGWLAAWYGHKEWQEHSQRKQDIIVSFSGLAVILEMFINESRQKHLDQVRWEQYEKEHVYDVIPEVAEVDGIIAPTDTQPAKVLPSKPPRSKPVSLEKAEPEQKNAATVQAEKTGRMISKNHPLALALASYIGTDQNQCKTLVDKTAVNFREKVLKVLAREPLLLKEKPSSEQLFNSNFYSHGLVVPLLYGTGIQREQVQEIQYADQIYTTLREGGFGSVRYILEGLLRCTGDCTKLFDAIEVSVAWINNPQRFSNALTVSGDKRPMPVIIYEMMADPFKREELIDLAKH